MKFKVVENFSSSINNNTVNQDRDYHVKHYVLSSKSKTETSIHMYIDFNYYHGTI